MSDKFIDNSEEELFFPEQGKNNPFVVPDGYFDKLSDRIVAKIELEEELKGYGLLSAIKKEEGFSLPADYFKSREDKLEYQQEIAAYEQLSKIDKPIVENTLEDKEYFSSAGEKILKRIEIADELKEYSLLYAIDKENNFAIDPDYFDTVADRVKERSYSEDVPNVSILDTLLSYVLKPKIALTYSIVFIIGIGLIVYNKTVPSASMDPGDCKTLACLEKRELLNEHTIRDLDDDNLYDMVDVDALDKQIATDSVKTDSISASVNNIDTIKNK